MEPAIISLYYTTMFANANNIKKFVIQKHTKTADPVHWDIMFETGDVLETFRLGIPPQQLCDKKATATKIFDHPVKFLTYQGSVNDGTGSVCIVESGTYQLLNDDPNNRQLQLDGNILKGKFTLELIEEDRWQFGCINN